MDKGTKAILSKLRSKKVGIFIDSSNIYYAQKKAGWRIDYKKLKIVFEKHCKLRVYNFYVAVPDTKDSSYSSTKRYLDSIGKIAKLRTKPLKYIRDGNKITKKGDVDLEITTDVVRNIKNLDQVILISGDSDYLELKNWVVEDNKKEILFISFEKNMAWEIKYCKHLFLDNFKEEIEYK